jgi:hypothetical protein
MEPQVPKPRPSRSEFLQTHPQAFLPVSVRTVVEQTAADTQKPARLAYAHWKLLKNLLGERTLARRL